MPLSPPPLHSEDDDAITPCHSWTMTVGGDGDRDDGDGNGEAKEDVEDRSYVQIEVAVCVGSYRLPRQVQFLSLSEKQMISIDDIILENIL